MAYAGTVRKLLKACRECDGQNVSVVLYLVSKLREQCEKVGGLIDVERRAENDVPLPEFAEVCASGFSRAVQDSRESSARGWARLLAWWCEEQVRAKAQGPLDCSTVLAGDASRLALLSAELAWLDHELDRELGGSAP